MDIKNSGIVLASERQQPFAPKLYYFEPLRAGPRGTWPLHLDRCRSLGFDCVLSPPPFAPAATGDIFLAVDHERADPAVGGSLAVDEWVAEMAVACRERGLKLYLDIVLGRVAPDAVLVKSKPHWFELSNLQVDPRSPWQAPAAFARFSKAKVADELSAWWIKRLKRLVDAGVSGFRCEDVGTIAPEVWRHIIAAVKHDVPACHFLAWTPGVEWQVIRALRGVGFAGAFSSLPWWNGRVPWFAEEYELLRQLGAVIGSVEAPFARRSAWDAGDALGEVNRARHVLRRAAVTSNGLLVPMSFEFGAHGQMPRLAAKPTCKSTIADEICKANAVVDQLAGSAVNGQMQLLSDPDSPVTAFLRAVSDNIRSARSSIVVLINTDMQRDQWSPIALNPLPAAAGSAAISHEAITSDRQMHLALAPGEVRLLKVEATVPIRSRRAETEAAQAAPRIVVDNVAPTVDQGRFAAKRIIGEAIDIEADAFTDGHEMLAVEILWRTADEDDWYRAPTRALGNDRWRATILPNRIGRHEFTVEAWCDQYATFVQALEIKHKAGADVHLEIIEGRDLLQRAKQRSKGSGSEIISAALNWLADATVATSIEILLSPDLREVMRENDERAFLYRCDPPFALEVERPQAAFAAWYELFPRSATKSPSRHGTFDDVIARLPVIRDMGFDVLYLTPIHPIGQTNRKGKNNSLEAKPDDVGSPYAIGSSGGGHDAIHPALGTIDDFRRLRDAVAEHGMEIALDFAVQCSPDHPWLREHPEWFSWRADGSLRYAENPPKKYQDIVNVDFYTPDAFPALWMALRDIVLFWIGEGVQDFSRR